MRPLIIGIILFLIWGSLSTWYYTTKLYSPGELTEVTATAPDTPLIGESPPEMPAIPEKPSGITLYFNFDKSEILPSGDLTPWLDECKDYLLADASSCLLVTGYTCSIGTENYNMALGMRRAEAVRKYFLANGFSAECLKINSKGEADPAMDNSTEAGRKMNRRTELKFGEK